MYQQDEYLVQCPKCNSRTVAEPITRYIDADDGSPFASQPPWDDLYVVVACKICYEYMLIAHPKDEKKSYEFRRKTLGFGRLLTGS